MFEMTRTLDVKAEDFFEKITDSLVFDINSSTGKNIRSNQISKGYTYNKKLRTKTGKAGTVKVTITEFESPVQYSAKFTSAQGDNFISYVITKTGDCEIEVAYTEDYVGATKSRNVNAKLMQLLYKRGNKKRVNRLLNKIEAFILNEYEEKEIENETTEIK